MLTLLLLLFLLLLTCCIVSLLLLPPLLLFVFPTYLTSLLLLASILLLATLLLLSSLLYLLLLLAKNNIFVKIIIPFRITNTRNERCIPRNNENCSEFILRNFFGTEFRWQPYHECTLKKIDKWGEGKPEQKFDAAFRTISRISKRFQRSNNKLYI